MQETASTKLPRFRFGLRSLFIVILAFAVLLFAARECYEWYFTVPMIPLMDAVQAFNARAGEDPVGELQPPLTEDEIVASIQAQLPQLIASGHDQIAATYSESARTKMVPRSARIDFMTEFQLANGQRFTVWWINLDIVAGSARYALRIRENNNPEAPAHKNSKDGRYEPQTVPINERSP